MVLNRTESTTVLTKGNIAVVLPSDILIHTAEWTAISLDQLHISPEVSQTTEITTSYRGILEVEEPSLILEDTQDTWDTGQIKTEIETSTEPSIPAENNDLPPATPVWEIENTHSELEEQNNNQQISENNHVVPETIYEETILVNENISKQTSTQHENNTPSEAVTDPLIEVFPEPKPAIQEHFEFWIPWEHLIFSSPVMIEYHASYPEWTLVEISVQHAWDNTPWIEWLSTENSTSCLPDWWTTKWWHLTQVRWGKVSFFTCGASIFTVTYTWWASFDNFVDASSTGKTITVTSWNIAPWSTIQDVNVIIDFWKIDGEDPATPWAGQAYSDEISFVLQSPLWTTVNLMTAGTYTNTANADRVTVTFDDSAASAPTNLPVTGTFLPTDNLSWFKFEDPIWDWLFTFADSVAQDGLILYSVSLEINAQELCGNGILNIWEWCDDGNTTNGDWCNMACNVENGYACNTSSPWLTGNLSCNSGICDFSETPDTCEPANTCGNNKLEIWEQCDDGNSTSFDWCSATCEVEFCGNGVIDTITSNTTLFLEDFESIGNGTVTTNSTIVSSTWYSLFYENSDPTWRARYWNQRVQDNGWAGAITFDVNPSWTFVQNYLIFQIDLTSAASATDLTLSFDFSHHGEESHVTDRVWIRWSNSDSRIEIYDRDANKWAAGTFTSVTNLDIDNTLISNGQYPSSTFQIRFGQEDNFPATSTTASDWLSIDNVQITGTPMWPSTNEACDDNNLTNNDGCDQACIIESWRECTGEPSSCTVIPAPSGLQLHYDWSFGGWLFTDISGNGFDGTQFNGVTTGNQNGETIMCFNGTNQYIERATNLTTSYPFTMSTWVKSDTSTWLRWIVSFARSTSTNRMYNIELNATTRRARAQNTTARYANGTTPWNTSERFLVTTVFNSNTSHQTYVNWTLEWTNTISVTYDTNTNKRLNIWRLADSSPTNYFDGCVDDVRFYTTALTSGQIYMLYAQPAALSTSYTTSPSPQLTWTIQWPLDTITITVSGNTYTWINDGIGWRTLSWWIIAPALANWTHPTTLTVTNPYGRSVTYTSSFIVDIPPAPSWDFCIAWPTSISFPQLTTEAYAQTWFTSASWYFQLIDSSGADSGYYTTLQITNLSGTTTILANTWINRQSTGIVLLSGTANTGVVLWSAFASWSVASGTVTYIKRDPAPNWWKIGTYWAPLELRLSLPAYIKPDSYSGTITYTLYEN